MVYRRKKQKWVKFTFRSHRIQLLLDKVLVFRILRRMHGRFWGLAAIFGLLLGIFICFMIRPDLIDISTALSEFGMDTKTAPYFAGTMFFTAYALWRWRNYLLRTLRRPQPISTLITLTIIGLYLVALMPISWKPWPWRIHMFGVVLAGISMALTVVIDTLLSKARTRPKRASRWIALRWLAFAMIVLGLILTFGSEEWTARFDVALIGEITLIYGYSIWVIVKTHQGEGNRSILAKLIQKIIIIR